MALLALYIIIKQAIAGNLSFQPLNPTAATAGWTGFLNALLFAVLAIAAFDIVAPMAEETRTPRRLVPRATIYVTIGAGLYWVFTSFGIVNAVPAKTMAGTSPRASSRRSTWWRSTTSAGCGCWCR